MQVSTRNSPFQSIHTLDTKESNISTNQEILKYHSLSTGEEVIAAFNESLKDPTFVSFLYQAYVALKQQRSIQHANANSNFPDQIKEL